LVITAVFALRRRNSGTGWPLGHVADAEGLERAVETRDCGLVKTEKDFNEVPVPDLEIAFEVNLSKSECTD